MRQEKCDKKVTVVLKAMTSSQSLRAFLDRHVTSHVGNLMTMVIMYKQMTTTRLARLSVAIFGPFS